MYSRNIIYLFLILILQLTVGHVAKHSLTFVIDDTYSMSNDIAQVIEASGMVFDTVTSSSSSLVDDFLLVTFNDPEPPKLVIKTRDHALFKKTLQSIDVHGGGNCPELSMAGIELALKESLPGSHLYVSTDASAQDAHLFESVKNLAIKKSCQITYLLTGRCENNDPNFFIYNSLARATSGQVFHIHKQEVTEIVKYIAESEKNPKTVIVKQEVPAGDNIVNIAIDPGMSEVLISVSGPNPKIVFITGPGGIEPKLETVVKLSTVLVVKIPESIPGTYTVTVGTTKDAVVTVTASTAILIKHGFLTVKPFSINDTSTQPISGVQSHLAIELTTKKLGATLMTAQILDMDDKVIAEFPLKLINKKQKLYMTDKALFPDSLFKIKVIGHDAESGSPFTRTIPTGIQPQIPSFFKPENRKPSVDVPAFYVIAMRDKPTRLLCKVSGYPKPDTIWVSDTGAILESTESIVEEPYDYLYTLQLDKVTNKGNYTCRATNSLGDASEVVLVEIAKEPPKIRTNVTVIHKLKGEDVEIPCRLDKGWPVPKMVWHAQYQDSQFLVTLSETSEVVNLKNVDESHSGRYSCAAMNEVGSDYHTIFLLVEYPPTIKDSAGLSIKSVKGRKTSLTCGVEGVPKPRVDWYMNGVKVVSDRKLHIYRDNSLRFLGSSEYIGEFKCVATNPLGSVSKQIHVDYYDPVSISSPERSTFEQKLGDDLTLPCRADGFPKPTLKWIHYSPDVIRIAENIRPSDSSGSLYLRNLRLQQGGFYVCVASNAETSANATYRVIVNVPPSIKRTGENIFTAVLGDSFTRLPCNATGNPKPDITWSKNGSNIASGTEWYDIQGDGTLRVKSLDEKSAGSYVCHATNKLGKDSKLYKLVVKPYPDDTTPSRTIHLKEGMSKDIECDIPHSKLDSLRWYKDGKIIENGELTLDNAQISDSGVYTCRVQNISFLNPESKSVKLVVGLEPFFTSEAEKLINFENNAYTFLDCEAYGEPMPKATWYAGDIELDINDMIYELKMTYKARGNYTCIVTNPFGSINRTFEISSSDCILDLNKDFTHNQPLMLDIRGNWIQPTNPHGLLKILHWDHVILHCPNGFTNIPNKAALATCDRKNIFKVNGKNYVSTELECRDEVGITVKKTGRTCSMGNSEEMKVGFMALSKFVEAYSVCLDKDKNVPVYTKHVIQTSAANIELRSDNKWYEGDSLPLNFDDAYDCDSQINHISSLLGRWFHKDDRCCFQKRQLINPQEVPPGLARRATFNYLNVVPQWSSCGSENWDELEKRIRNLANDSYGNIDVWTGGSEVLKLQDNRGYDQSINLEDNKYRQQTVPKYLWKVVQSPLANASLAIVQLNMPDVDLYEAYKHMTCVDICSDVAWMKVHNWRNPKHGFTFCCSLDQFEAAFGHRGVFGYEYRNILNSVAPFYSSVY